MRASSILAIAPALMTTALAAVAKLPEAPMEAYSVIIPEWELETHPGGPTVILKGTVQEVHAELVKINPNYDEDFGISANRIVEPSGGDDHGLSKRWSWDNAQTFCTWPNCDVRTIQDGIDYLRGLSGQPRSAPGPGHCARVSCSYRAAIWWCNDSRQPKTLGSFGEIADGAQHLVKVCRDVNDPNGYSTNGQAFNKDDWNVIVRKDTYNC